MQKASGYFAASECASRPTTNFKNRLSIEVLVFSMSTFHFNFKLTATSVKNIHVYHDIITETTSRRIL